MANNITVETFKIKGWKEKETGLLVAENEKWILVKHIPVDYLVDGYKLYKKKFIKSRESKEREAQVAHVLGLKGVKAKKPKGFEFAGVVDTLKWSEKKYGLFEFQDSEEGALQLGKINTVSKKSLFIDFITAEGKLKKAFKFSFKTNEIRSITFESDYFNSIKLLMDDVMASEVKD